MYSQCKTLSGKDSQPTVGWWFYPTFPFETRRPYLQRKNRYIDMEPLWDFFPPFHGTAGDRWLRGLVEIWQVLVPTAYAMLWVPGQVLKDGILRRFVRKDARASSVCDCPCRLFLSLLMCLRVEAEICPFVGTPVISEAAKAKVKDQTCKVIKAWSALACTKLFLSWNYCFGFSQSWLQEEATLVIKGEKIYKWSMGSIEKEKNKKTPCNVFWCTLKLEVRSSVLHYFRVGWDSAQGFQALWFSGKGLYLTGQKYSTWGLGLHRIRQRASKPVPWWSEGFGPGHFCWFGYQLSSKTQDIGL